MRILVTGLCLSRNLGGPAMGLTLVEQLKRRFSDIDFVFAIDPNSYEKEKEWADYYGLKIVRRDTFVSNFINSNCLMRILKRYKRYIEKKPSVERTLNYEQVHQEFMNAFRESDAIINMMGISYVGDRVRGHLEGPSSYSNLYYANKNKKPFAHFIQSFGPFDEPLVRFFARKDFEQVDFVPARGKKSARYCREIVSDPSKVYDFPDSAILLPSANEDWINEYLKKLNLTEKNYVVLSPSAVIFNMPTRVGGSVGKNHVLSFFKIAKALLQQGKSILFLPHMYSDNKTESDREICFNILELLKNENADQNRTHVVCDDIDVYQAKGLISKSNMAIVSRYHALVAAISTAVPVITIGWNVKYFDLMSYYDIENMSIDTRNNFPDQISKKVMNLIEEYGSRDYSEQLRSRQQENEKKVLFAFDLLGKWIREHVEAK